MTLNFHPILLGNARAYAARHNMKLNAVFKAAFELLQDQEEKAKLKERLLKDNDDQPY